MCGRMTLTLRELDDVVAQLAELLAGAGPVDVDDEVAAQYRPRYNAAPGQLHLVLRRPGRRTSLGLGTWGLRTRPDRPAVINARAESAPFRAPFREAFAHRRCLIPADGFFEWQKSPAGRQPLWYHRPDGKLLLLAGLFDEEPAAAGVAGIHFAILTTAPNQLVAKVHDRMPAVLDAGEAAAWLADPAQRLLHPASEATLVATPVSARVNSVKNDDAGCLAPPQPSGQLRLL